MYTLIKMIEIERLYFYNINKCSGTNLLRPLA